MKDKINLRKLNDKIINTKENIISNPFVKKTINVVKPYLGIKDEPNESEDIEMFNTEYIDHELNKHNEKINKQQEIIDQLEKELNKKQN